MKSYLPILTTKEAREIWLETEGAAFECFLVEGRRITFNGGIRIYATGEDPAGEALLHILKNCWMGEIQRIRKSSDEDYPALRFFREGAPALRWTPGCTVELQGNSQEAIQLFCKLGFTVSVYPLAEDKMIIHIDPQFDKLKLLCN